jgi:hypothetical protein
VPALGQQFDFSKRHKNRIKRQDSHSKSLPIQDAVFAGEAEEENIQIFFPIKYNKWLKATTAAQEVDPPGRPGERRPAGTTLRRSWAGDRWTRFEANGR